VAISIPVFFLSAELEVRSVGNDMWCDWCHLSVVASAERGGVVRSRPECSWFIGLPATDGCWPSDATGSGLAFLCEPTLLFPGRNDPWPRHDLFLHSCGQIPRTLERPTRTLLAARHEEGIAAGVEFCLACHG
jgi:hypothetical protein